MVALYTEVEVGYFKGKPMQLSWGTFLSVDTGSILLKVSSLFKALVGWEVKLWLHVRRTSMLPG